MFEKDLILIGGRFLDEPVPKEKQYLYRYFKTDAQKSFVRYSLDFGNCVHFVEHTGIYRSSRWLKRMKHRLEVLEQAYAQAKIDGDFELITEISMGKWRPEGGFPKY